MTPAVEMFAVEIAAEAASTRHHGRPGLPARSKARWADRVAERVGPHDLASCAAQFVAHPHPTVRQVGLALLARPGSDAATAERLAGMLADDPDWEVREWVAEPLIAHTVRGGPAWLERWVQEGAGRRLVLRGVLDGATALAVATCAVDDPNAYVAASVGTFLLADGICLRCRDEFGHWVESLGPCPPDSPRPRHLAAVAGRHPRAVGLGGQRPGPTHR